MDTATATREAERTFSDITTVVNNKPEISNSRTTIWSHSMSNRSRRNDEAVCCQPINMEI